MPQGKQGKRDDKEFPTAVVLVNPLDLQITVTMTVRDLERIRLGLLALRRNLEKELEDLKNLDKQERLNNIRINEEPRLDDLLRRVRSALDQFVI